MSKGYRILISALAVIFSLASACIGFALTGNSSLSFPVRVGCDFVFIVQFTATVWCVIYLGRTKEGGTLIQR